MNSIDFNCLPFGKITFGGDRLRSGYDRVIRSNCARHDLELLLFFDSRGISATYSGSIAERLLTLVESSRSYLLICRPLELTTWATLFNFLTLNELSPKTIVTNVGFVDFTPKKQSILDDAVRQVEVFMGKDTAHSRAVEHYASDDGEQILLFSMRYDDAYRRNIETVLTKGTTVVVNSPPLVPGISLRRKRPRAFYTGLAESIKFNRSLNGVAVIDFPAFDETKTYDGVHYTQLGNEIVFREIAKYL
jgi:hypothetical protein